MADQSPFILQQKANHRPKESYTATGSSKSWVAEGNNLGFPGYHDSLVLKNNNSTRILAPEMIEANQEYKRRCLEKLVNAEDVKRALQVEVIDDTALIEATAAVTRFKNCYRKEVGVGFGKTQVNAEENDGKNKKKNKGFKKQGTGCSMKCMSEKKMKGKVVEGKSGFEKRIPEGKGYKGGRKMYATVKYVYQRKGTKNSKILEDQDVSEKILGGEIQETETDVNLKVLDGNETESTIKLVETEIVNEKDDGLKLNPEIDVQTHNEAEDQNACANADVGSKTNAHTREEMETPRFVDEVGAEDQNVCATTDVGSKKNAYTREEMQAPRFVDEVGAEDQNVCATTDVGLKKNAYTREEMEALRFVDEQGQKTKWNEVYSGFAAFVAREYTRLVVDANNRPAQRYNRAANCGSTSHANPVLIVPPVLPLYSPSNYRKFDRVRCRVNTN